jgi:acetoacetyl-CoA synthetase
MSTPRWTPSPERVASANLTAFMAAAHRRAGAPPPADPQSSEAQVRAYDALHAWSVSDVARFWSWYVAWAGLGFDRPADRVLAGETLATMRWFEGGRLNYARALIHGGGRPDAEEALVAVDELGSRRVLDRAGLVAEVARVQSALLREGVGPGDRVAAMAVNGLEAVVALLACAGLGAIFTSCSPDFGAPAARSRFAQVAPALLLASPSYRYGGRRFDVTSAARALRAALPSLRRLVWLPVPGEEPPIPEGAGEAVYDVWCDGQPHHLVLEPLPFDHPLAVLYSSGTTGIPKAIVHRAGGVLLTHHKEHALHLDVRPGDRVAYFTTLGWMMWNWLVSALAQGATVVLVDGSPAVDPLALWRLAERERLTFLGVGARFLHAQQAAGVRPDGAVDLGALRTLASTGSPLAPSAFAYVHESVKADVHLASISGGTDIVGCFMLGVPTLPVHDGQIQRPGLAVDVAVFDDAGGELTSGAGELVCRSPLPSMPLGFWGDVDGSRYRATYFERFPGVWWHGDRIERTPQGGIVVFGRSDATLNPGGVRIGTAEIYRPLEEITEVLEACAVGRRVGDDEEVWLLVVLREGARVDEALVASIRDAVRRHTSPRHVPRRVLQVRELPRTRSGKPMELVSRAVVNGDAVVNREAMDNPHVIDEIAAAVAAVEGGGVRRT